MSTVTESEAALTGLSSEDLRRVEAAVPRAQRQEETTSKAKSNPRLRALDGLQARLALDARKAETWFAKVQDARR